MTRPSASENDDRPPAQGWERVRLRSGVGKEVGLLVRPVPSLRPPPSGGPPVAHEYLPERPILVRTAGGRPAVSLQAFLAGRPDPVDGRIGHLVTSGRLAFTVALALDAADEQALTRHLRVPVRPAFAQEAVFQIRKPGSADLLGESVHAVGMGCRASFSVPLDAGQVRQLLDTAALPGSALELSARVSIRGHRREAGDIVATRTALPDLLGAVIGDDPTGAVVQFLVPVSDGVGFAPLGRRRSSPGNAARRAPDGGGMRLAPLGGRLVSLPLALTTDTSRRPSPHALIMSNLVQPAGASAWLAGDLVLEPAAPSKPPPLPVVDQLEPPFWPDRSDPSLLWYAPGFRLVVPSAAAAAGESAAFWFGFRRVGVTAEGVPGLEATIRFTLEPVAPPGLEAAAAQRGAREARSVPLDAASVMLELPFREEATGVTRRQLIPAVAEVSDGRIVATVTLLDSWARLCYGALATEGFQEEPARLSVALAFPALTPLPRRPELIFAGMAAVTAVRPGVASRSPGAGAPLLDAINGSLRLGSEAAVAARGTHRRSVKPVPSRRFVVPARVLRGTASISAGARPLPPSAIGVIARPHLSHLASWASFAAVMARDRTTRTVVRHESVDAFVSCTEHGGLYVEETSEGDLAIGCRSHLQLGEIEYRLYDPLPDFEVPGVVRVFRSLRQPGRYLLIPAAYRVGRYGPAEPVDKAYRPAFLIFATAGGNPPEPAYHLSATLEPDLPAHLRRDLEDRLRIMTPGGRRPILELPTDPSLAAGIEYHWEAREGEEEPEFRQIWDGFQVDLRANLAQALALVTLIEATGVEWGVSFRLADGTAYSSRLVVDTHPVGPWIDGPVRVELDGAQARLVNEIERSVQVRDLLLEGADGEPVRVRVDRELAPGDEARVQIPGGVERPCATAEPDAGPVKLARLNLFVEDVQTNALFVNLVSHANRGLRLIRVEARLADRDQVHLLELEEAQTGSLDLTLDLTTYLESQVLEFRLTAVPTEGEPVTGPWLTWDLRGLGNVLSITPEILPQSHPSPEHV